jgi:hypothetical protein
MLHQEDAGAAVALENGNEFGAAVAAEADDARFDHVLFTQRGDYLFTAMNNYNTQIHQ